MNAGTPGQSAGPFDCPPALYARWVRADFPDATDGKVDRLWHAKVGQVRVARWKRDAGMELTEGERRMAGA